MSGAQIDGPSRVPSGVGGTSAGVVLAGGGLEVGADTTVGKILLLLSPATSVVVGSLLFYLRIELGRYQEGRMVAKARRTLVDAIDNPRYTEPEREYFRKVLLQLDRTVVSRQLERVQAVGAVPDPPPS